MKLKFAIGLIVLSASAHALNYDSGGGGGGAGTITGVTAGTGLTGGGSSGSVTLNVAASTNALTWTNTPAASDIVTVASSGGGFTAATALTGVTATGGWVQDSNTWTGLGATSATVNADMSSQLVTGDRIKFTNGGSTIFVYLATVTVSGGTSTLTFDPVLSSSSPSNGAITNPFYSHSAEAAGFPDWVPVSPSTTTGFSAAPTLIFMRYKEIGRMVFVQYHISAGGTSSTTAYTVALPVTSAAANTGLGSFGPSFGAAACIDNGAAVNTGVWNVPGASTVVQFFKSTASTVWTGSGTKGCVASFSYER